MTQANIPQKPDKEFKAGKMSVAIWGRQEQAADGHTFTSYSIRAQKRYLDPATQEWKTADYLFADDLPRLILVAQEAYRYIALKEKEQNDEVAA